MTRFNPGGSLRGTLEPPPDKSISHRAAMIAGFAEGETRVENFLLSADTGATADAVRQVGAGVHELERSDAAATLSVTGVGLRGARPARIDVMNAGTLMRLLPGLLAGQPQGEWTLDGDESIRRRPVDRVADPLRLMGAQVESSDGRPPLSVRGAPLHGIEYRLPVASAQVKSCVLLAGLNAEGPTSVIEQRPTRDHTERMLRAAGARVRSNVS